MYKFILGGVALLALVPFLGHKDQAVQPDVNAVCGPAITKQLDSIMLKRMYKPVHVQATVSQKDVTVDGIFTTGTLAYRVLAKCILVHGQPQVSVKES